MEAKSYVYRSYRVKTGRGGLFSVQLMPCYVSELLKLSSFDHIWTLHFGTFRRLSGHTGHCEALIFQNKTFLQSVNIVYNIKYTLKTLVEFREALGPNREIDKNMETYLLKFGNTRTLNWSTLKNPINAIIKDANQKWTRNPMDWNIFFGF